MSISGVSSSQCEVMVMGAPMSTNALVWPKLAAVEVDSTMFLPSQFKLTFHGMPDEVLLPGGLQLATPVVVAAPSSEGVPTPLMTGEVTAVEVEYDLGSTLTIVRGADRSNRLMRGTTTMAYPEMTASDVVAMLCGEAGVIPGEIMPTDTIYDWLTQANVSAWTFIQQLAALEGYVAYSDAMGLFNFCPMPMPEEGAPPAVSYLIPPMGNQLVLGKNLFRLKAVTTSAEQVPAVTVTGYDPSMAIPVVGPFPTIPSTSQSEDPGVLPPVIAGEFTAKPFFDSSRPFDDEGGAMGYAKSVAADLAGAMGEMEGECVGNPGILAGKSISLGMAGLPFDGYYVCTAARHVFDPEQGGYTTWFTVGGFRDRSLFALSSGGTPTDRMRPSISGLVVGTVIMNEDPESLGQVKVMFPWLAPSYISAWCRVMQIGASKAGGGFLWIPEIGDEVLVGFDRGSIDHPYVIGNLYNGISMPIPPPSVEGLVANRRIASRMGHTIQWDDGPEKLGITIATAPAEAPPASVVLDGEEMKVTVNSLGQIEISAIAEMKISCEGPLSIDATQISIGSEDTVSLSIAGAQISLGSETTATVAVTASGTASVSAPMVSLGEG